MTDNNRLDRRKFVQLTGATAATAFIAGCAGGDGNGVNPSEDGNGDGGNGDDGNGDGGNGDDGNGGNGNGGDGEFLAEEPDYEGFFDGVENYEGTADMTGQDSVSVSVGAGGGLMFEPPAVAVSPGTTVTWEWTGEGGAHNVAAEDGAFESDTVEEEGHTFEHTFEEEGVFTYVCTPHEALGMKGAIVVQ